MEQNDPLIGTTVGNYEVKELLGEGAMGQVYLGEHPQIGRKVAIKVLIGSLSANPEMADRFLSEAKAVNKISHPNIIQVFDFGKLPDGRLYLTMEYLEGEDLSGFMVTKRKMSLELTSKLLRQISSALDAAHSVGIVHRDLKPDNIFIIDNGDGNLVVKLLDFGVAKLLEPDFGAKHKTATGLIMGTPSYMCPEQAAGDVNNITAKSDIYALGIIVYQMLSERLPIEADIVPKVLVKHIAEPPTPIFEYLPDFPAFVWQVIEKTLAKAPDDRYESAGEFSREFDNAIENLSEAMTSMTFAGSKSAASAMNATMAASSGRRGPIAASSGTHVEGEAISVPSSKKGFLIAIIAVVVVGIAVGGFFFYRHNQEDGEINFKKTTPANSDAMKPAIMKAAAMKVEIKAPVMAVAAMPVIKEFTLNVSAYKGRKIKVNVTVGKEKPVVKLTPFDLKVAEKTEVTLRPASARYGKEQKITVESDKKVVLQPSKRSYTKHTMKVTKTPVMKPITVMKVVRTMKTMKKSMIGEGTIKVMW